jgi:hypothetical protein
MTVNTVCVDEAPVAQVVVTGDNEHPVNVTGDMVGTIPVNGTLGGTVPLQPGVERVITVTVDRGDGPGKPFNLTQAVTGLTDCAPVEPPVVTPPKPPKSPDKPGPCGTHTCPRDLDVTHTWTVETCAGWSTWKHDNDGDKVLISSVPKRHSTCDQEGTPALDDETGL